MSTIALYVGNLPLNFSNNQIEEIFSPFDLRSISSMPGRPFAYVEVPSDHAEDAMSQLNGSLMGSHFLVVKHADYSELSIGSA